MPDKPERKSAGGHSSWRRRHHRSALRRRARLQGRSAARGDGAIDEAVAALGLARARTGRGGLVRQPAPDAGPIARADPAPPARAVRVGAELATTPEAVDRGKPGDTRVTAEMVDGLDALLAETEAAIELPPRIRRPGRDASVRGAGAGPNHRPAGGAASSGNQPRRTQAGRSNRSLPEPIGGPAVDPRPRRRAG